MQLTARQEFSAPCDHVYAMSVDPAFLEQVCRDLDAPSHTVAVSGPPDAAVTRVSAEIETPGPMRPVAGPSVTVGQEMAWGPASADGSRTARLILKVAGMPVEVDAHARLAPTASGCAVEYSGTLAVKVPILGPALEKQSAPFILDTLAIQERSGNAWLASQR